MSTTESKPIAEVLDGDNRRLLRVERTMFKARWVAVAFSLVQILTFYKPHPPGLKELALGAVLLLAVGNVALYFAFKAPLSPRKLKRRSVLSIALDFVCVHIVVFVYAFDQETAIWAVLYVLPLVGATRFQLRGALIVTALSGVVYTFRELYGSGAYDYDFLVTSITFRIGLAFVIAYTAGNMSATLTRESRSVETTNVHLEEMNQAMSEFVAIASHEMRTPLSVITGLSSVLLSNWDSFSDEKQRELLEVVNRQGGSLDKLVTDLLTASSLESGAVTPLYQTVDVKKSLDEAMSHLAFEEPVQVRAEEGLIVKMDEQHLQRIVTNLVTNANKYGKHPIKLNAVREGGRVVISVCDAGSGVPEEFVPRLFKKFARAKEHSTDQTPGTGLGLSIVRGLVEANGGTVEYRPGDRGGAEFVVVFPEGAKLVSQ